MPRARRQPSPTTPDAHDWLRAQLSGGPRNPFLLWRDGAAVGLHWSAINDAAAALGVVLTASTPPGPEWRLPTAPQSENTP